MKTIREQLAEEKKKKFDGPFETQGYRNGIKVAEIICEELIKRDEKTSKAKVQVPKVYGDYLELKGDNYKVLTNEELKKIAEAATELLMQCTMNNFFNADDSRFTIKKSDKGIIVEFKSG